MSTLKKIFIMAGEASGDMHGGMLVSELKSLNKSLKFYGVGGGKLAEQGVDLLYDYSEFSSMGIIEPILKLQFYRKALKKILDHIEINKIKNVILIDFPGFNLLLAEKLKKNNIKIIYYISPQIWAWHYSRIKKIKRYVDAMIVLYPFEEKIYKSEGVNVFFAGNPLLDIVKERLGKAHDIKHKSAGLCIGLLPGSRLSEVKRHLKPILDSVLLLQERFKSSFLLPVHGADSEKYAKDFIKQPAYNTLKIKIIFDNTYKAMEKSDFLIISSGTATLEAAIIGKPMVVIYKVDIISELVARLVIKVDNIALVNIVSGKRICPELLQRDANGENIFGHVSKYLDNPKLLNNMIKEINIVKHKLGKPGAVKRIAKVVLSHILK